jgi:membrane-associated protein
VSSLLDRLLHLHGVLVYLLVAALVFAEDALFVGFVLPGETAAVLGGVIASQGRVQLWLMIVLVVAAAIVGDTVGYEIGRHIGPRILRLRILDKRRRRLDDAPKRFCVAAAAGLSSSAGSSRSSAP